MLLKPMLSLSPLRCAGGTLLPSCLIAKKRFSSSPSVRCRWPGLQTWRESSLNENRGWGSNGPEPPLSANCGDNPRDTIPSLAEWGTLILSTSDPLTKSRLSHLAYTRYRLDNLPVGVSQPPDRPARPPKPPLYKISMHVISFIRQLIQLSQTRHLQRATQGTLPFSTHYMVSPKEIPAPKNSGFPLNAYMLHNLAHVELNAIDLAWDTVVRFSPFIEALGDEFFSDFAHVADDESRHFRWCSQRLAELGFNYGDMPAHNFLWRECERSSGSVAARLAVIPLVQEARGLDAGPRLVQKLIGFGDHRTSDIVAKIADEEVAHVAVGVFWFLSVCQKMGRVPCTTFKDLLKELNVELKGPFNYSARDVAGIPRDWYDGSSADKGDMSKLSEVYDRLACIISMEKENSSLDRHPR